METFNFLPNPSGFNSSVLFHLPVISRSYEVNQSCIDLPKHRLIYQQFEPFKESATAFILSISYSQVILFTLCVAWALGPVISKGPGVSNAVYHGYRSWIEPTFL